MSICLALAPREKGVRFLTPLSSQLSRADGRLVKLGILAPCLTQSNTDLLRCPRTATAPVVFALQVLAALPTNPFLAWDPSNPQILRLLTASMQAGTTRLPEPANPGSLSLSSVGPFRSTQPPSVRCFPRVSKKIVHCRTVLLFPTRSPLSRLRDSTTYRTAKVADLDAEVGSRKHDGDEILLQWHVSYNTIGSWLSSRREHLATTPTRKAIDVSWNEALFFCFVLFLRPHVGTLF